MTNLKKFYDYREYDEPIDLYEFLNQNKSTPSKKGKLYDMKILYIIKPNRDSMVKFGIAGHKEGKDSAWGRLFQYVNSYGIQDDLNQCSGVQLLYVVGHKYNSNVEPTQSFVHKNKNILQIILKLRDRKKYTEDVAKKEYLKIILQS